MIFQGIGNVANLNSVVFWRVFFPKNNLSLCSCWLQKPMPRFAYHRVPGSFAAFRLIKPAFTEEQLPSVSVTSVVELECAGMSWNQLESAGTRWRQLESAEMSWNQLESAKIRTKWIIGRTKWIFEYFSYLALVEYRTKWIRIKWGPGVLTKEDLLD